MTELGDTAHSRHLRAGETRNCLDPWTYVELKVNGDVSPCCVRPPIGNINTTKLPNLLTGTAMRNLRRALLEGTLDHTCQKCGLRAPTSPAALTQRVAEMLQSMTLPPDFDESLYLAANPDVRAASIDPVLHFLRFGRLEGRPISPASAPVK
jgi:Iron-sulfur cluster-binding domain